MPQTSSPDTALAAAIRHETECVTWLEAALRRHTARLERLVAAALRIDAADGPIAGVAMPRDVHATEAITSTSERQ